MIELKDYIKSYKNKLVLEIPFLKLEKNLYWIKGINGSGKSTLLKSIAGIIPYKGTIQIDGIPDDRKHRMIYRKLVNYCPAEANYPEFITGNELIQIQQETCDATESDVENLKNRFNATYFLDQHIVTYSSGMKKKLSLIIAFTGNPILILLDEPMAALDQEAMSVTEQLINERINNNTSIIMTSHQEIATNGLLRPTILEVKNNTLFE